jgi:hypothetical protein
MNDVYPHLVLNHAPLVLGCVGALAAVVAIATGRRTAWLYATITLVVAGVAVVPSYVTGLAAEEGAQGLQRAALEEHETAAGFALAALLIAGAVAGEALRRMRKGGDAPRGLRIAVVVVALWASSVVARTAYLGGELVHGATAATDVR